MPPSPSFSRTSYGPMRVPGVGCKCGAGYQFPAIFNRGFAGAYLQDNFQRPNAFSPDVAVANDDVIDAHIDMLDAHLSQFYEWLPWVAGTPSSARSGCRGVIGMWIAFLVAHVRPAPLAPDCCAGRCPSCGVDGRNRGTGSPS